MFLRFYLLMELCFLLSFGIGLGLRIQLGNVLREVAQPGEVQFVCM